MEASTTTTATAMPRPLKGLLVGALAAAGLAAGCATAPQEPHALVLDGRPSCRPPENGPQLETRARHTAEATEAWLALVEYLPREVYDAGPRAEARALARRDEARYLAVLSYPGGGDRLSTRSFVYDNALALLWTSWTGRRAEAESVANTLILLQNDDGSWGFGFDVRDGFYNAAYVRNGAVAWVAWALSYHGRRDGHPEALAAAHRALGYLDAQRVREEGAAHEGLIRLGRGQWVDDGTRFESGPAPDAAATEHQLDAAMAAHPLAPSLSRDLAKSLLQRGWIEAEGRFAQGLGPGRPDSRGALDAAGAWGALWLASRGDTARAERSLDWATAALSARHGGLVGWGPYTEDPMRARGPWTGKLIFAEGSLSMGLAAARLGDHRLSQRALALGVALACLGGPGVPYANIDLPDFPTRPAAAPSLWFLFLEREWATGQQAPLFPTLPDDEKKDGSHPSWSS